uniref:Ras-GEF domain-containing protein n=1 Tax=Globisporangium ultimum (strain ATCC 200006 / CBS 805.95 / DAOM BR144) TaxID=431595 RepID=K3WPG2_GLOUD
MSFICQGTGDEDVTAWVCHLQSLCGGTGEFATSAIGTAAAGGLHPGGMTAGAMDDRSIRIVAELRRLLHTSKSPESVKCKNFVKSFECRSPSALRQFRDFHASLTNSIMKDHANRILKHLEETRQGDSSSSARQLPSVMLSDIRSAVSRHVEEVLFTPLQDSIYVFMRRAFQEDDSSINRKVRWLQGKDQTFYNIPLHQISWKEWRKASKVLAQIGHLALPSSKYDVLMNTVSTIQATFGEEHNMVADAEPLETDDIIPIFTYVLANSGLENLLSLKTLLTELNGSWAVGGSLDDGAALSILNHAVDFISNVSIPAVLEDIFKDQITLSIDGDWRRVLEFEVEPTYRYGAVVQTVSSHGYSTVGSTITRGSVLVTINGQSVVLWPFQDIMTLLKESTHPHRLAFIPGASYFKILTSNKSLWNVALIHACQRGDVMSVQMLLANGADVNYVAYECGGNTPLHVAVSALHFNVVSYILQHGAKVKAIGEYGRTALHMVGAPCTLSSASSAFSASTALAGTTLRNGANTNKRDGETEIVAGTFSAIVNLLLQSEHYRLDEADALIWYCEYGGYYQEMVNILRELLKRHEGTVKGFYVRRMVLHALNKLVENLKHKVERDTEVCAYISAFCEELFPFTIDDDPQCAQWLSASLLPLYVEACRMQRMQEFQILSFCEDDYTSLKHFLCSAKQNHPSLKFLDDDLFATATGIEIISQSTRRRLSVAGLWTGDAKMSFVVKAEENDPVLYEPAASTITPWQPRGMSRSLQFDRGSRPWILDIDASVIAQQITLFQHYLFSKIKVTEILASKKCVEKTPAYQRLRLLHNHISVWVVSQILSRDDVDQRAEILSYFVKVAAVLLNPLQNLDGFMAVMNATNDSSIYRLKKTWGRLSPQARDLWHDLKLHTEKGARPLNKLTKEGTPPLIPYMGVVIQNIIALQEFPDRVEGDLINFKKIRSIGGLISRFLSFQKAAYLLPTDKRVLEFICTSVQYPDADACFQRSLKVEPRVEAPNGGP